MVEIDEELLNSSVGMKRKRGPAIRMAIPAEKKEQIALAFIDSRMASLAAKREKILEKKREKLKKS